MDKERSTSQINQNIGKIKIIFLLLSRMVGDAVMLAKWK
jgi:hypothetical protein